MDPRPKKNILRDDNDNPVYDKKGHVIEIPPGEDAALLHRARPARSHAYGGRSE